MAANQTKHEEERLLVARQQSSGLLAAMWTAAAYRALQKTAKAEKQVNSKHASWELAGYSLSRGISEVYQDWLVL